MNTAKEKMISQKSYVPDVIVTNYMREKLQFGKEKEKLGLRGKDLQENSAYSNLRKRKTDALDRIFVSMANLTFFFECVAKNPDLEELFEDDIKDLLGVRRNDQNTDIYGFILARLLYSILIVHKSDNNYNDFRLRLNNLLQQVVWNKASQTLIDVFKPEGVQPVANDFDRVKAWTAMLAYNVRPEDKKPRRTFDFHTDELLKKKQK